MAEDAGSVDAHGEAGLGPFVLRTTVDNGGGQSCMGAGLATATGNHYGVVSVLIQGREFQLLKAESIVVIATKRSQKEVFPP